MDPRRPLLLRITRACATAAASLGSMLICVLVSAGPAYGLDPNKRVTQYIHTSWRIQDGSLPAGMFSITQTSDGFCGWCLSQVTSTGSMAFASYVGLSLPVLQGKSLPTAPAVSG
jgi:hypothetical protein